jgi:archaellum component FlaC
MEVMDEKSKDLEKLSERPIEISNEHIKGSQEYINKTKKLLESKESLEKIKPHSDTQH